MDDKACGTALDESSCDCMCLSFPSIRGAAQHHRDDPWLNIDELAEELQKVLAEVIPLTFCLSPPLPAPYQPRLIPPSHTLDNPRRPARSYRPNTTLRVPAGVRRSWSPRWRPERRVLPRWNGVQNERMCVLHPVTLSLPRLSANPTLAPDTPTAVLLPFAPYLDRVLKRNDFISYWLPALSKKPYVALRFLPQRAYRSMPRSWT
ncbi:hypothetical protein LXA43DRAFT_500372 [Ganoderma leucocontextum]|nr:hypothetical protein LXA43DRAFT_500372 [Ganoderma leucocontextum]